LLPWSAKAGELLRNQYASVGAAARTVLPEAVDLLSAAMNRGQDVSALLATTVRRATNATKFTEAYGRYCWPTEGLAGVRIAPFQILAGAAENYAASRDHPWHLDVIDRLIAAAPDRFTPTGRRLVDVTDAASIALGVDWWETLTSVGGEGIVVKPVDGFVRGSRGLVQPGVKCRGRDYLRIIYGPDYADPGHLDRLRERGLGRKRALALREYALGLEALDRLVEGEPLWRVHEPVFAVLAMESEPVDPRL
jgi:protein phosphatase